MRTILTIDDDIVTHRFVAKALEEKFEVVEAYSGEDGLELATALNPDLILLDVEMPGLNGYEVCDKLKHTEGLAKIPVVFLSSRGSLQERMHGYEVGAADYLVKPFEREALLVKTEVLLNMHENASKLADEIKEIRQTAHIALSASAELGTVVQFVERCFELESLDQLGLATIKICTELQLNVVVMLADGPALRWYGHNGTVSPLESQVIEMLRDRKRFNDFGTRTVINYPNISLMIKNMPLEDPERYGRIKDLVPAIMSTVNGKAEGLARDREIRNQSQEIAATFEKASESLAKLFQLSNESRQAVYDIQNEMFQEIQHHLPNMGLDEDQEMYILNRMDKAIEGVKAVEESHSANRESIRDVLVELQAIAESQQKLVDSMSPSSEQAAKKSGQDDLHSVELF